MFKMNFLYFNLCLLSLVLPLAINEKSLAQSSLHSPIRYLHTLIRSPLRLLFVPLTMIVIILSKTFFLAEKVIFLKDHFCCRAIKIFFLPLLILFNILTMCKFIKYIRKFIFKTFFNIQNTYTFFSNLFWILWIVSTTSNKLFLD